MPDRTEKPDTPRSAITPPAHRLRVVRYARWGGYSPRQWAVAFVRTDWHEQGRCLKSSDRPAAVWRAELTPQKRPIDCIIKVESCTGLVDVARLALGATRFHRQWAGAETLHEAGVLTGRPKALLVGGRGADRRVCLVLDALPGRTVLEHLADPDRPVSLERALCASVALQLARMRNAGVRNRDHKPSNLIAVPIEGGPGLVCGVIDTMGIQKGRVGDAALRWMLASLMIEPIGVGATPRVALRMRMLRALHDTLRPNKRRKRARWGAWRNETWKGVDALVVAHDEPTPTDDPLHGAS
jgi:hypothetical protein